MYLLSPTITLTEWPMKSAANGPVNVNSTSGDDRHLDVKNISRQRLVCFLLNSNDTHVQELLMEIPTSSLTTALDIVFRFLSCLLVLSLLF